MVEAKLIDFIDEKIYLHKVNGVKIAVHKNKLLIEDLEYVEKTTGVSTKGKDKPIKFKDAIGRKFNFPFDAVNTWSVCTRELNLLSQTASDVFYKGMEHMIKGAFSHVADLGSHVADGQYDLFGPEGEIIMPSIWESVIEPGWEITMHMWPIAEPSQSPPEQNAIAGGTAPRSDKAGLQNLAVSGQPASSVQQ